MLGTKISPHVGFRARLFEFMQLVAFTASSGSFATRLQ